MREPNYIVIFLVLLLIGVYGYYSDRIFKLEEVIYQQDLAIKSQNKLIYLYNLYYVDKNLNNTQINDSQRYIIKEPI